MLKNENEPGANAAVRPGAFPITQWSLILQAGAGQKSQAHAALEHLCRQYWKPLYTFVRRQGRGHHEAEDCAQEFLAHLLAADALQRARPERGRFRTFLLGGLRNFLTSEWRRTQAAKRGGGSETVPIPVFDLNEPVGIELEDPGLTPEQAFDRTWALGMIDRAVAEARAEYERTGREAVFDSLAPLIWGHVATDSLVEHAARLQLTMQAFSVALHRARRRLGERLRAMVAETVADPADIDAELRHLINAINRTA